MAGVRLNVGLKSGRSRICSRNPSRDGSSVDALNHAIAVASTKRDIVLTSNDENRSGERGRLWRIADSQELTSRYGLFGFLRFDSEANVILARVEESVCQSGEVRVREVTGRVVVLEHCVVVTVNQIVELGRANVVPNLRCIDIDINLVEESCETGYDVSLDIVLLGESLNTSGGSIAKAERLIQACAV